MHDQGDSLVTDHSEPNGVAELTVKIVSAYVSKNTIAQSELPELITTVASRLRRGSAEAEQPAEESPKPAVSVRRSIRPDHLVCLVCGQPQKMLKRHLAIRHDLTPAQYRERFGLKPDYPMAAPKYAQQRRELALQTGLGRPKKPASRGRRSPGRAQQPEPSTAATP
jgi:MucR family transcriptional regulator, transcriptional regulator of exopolysaccharide biosynthesis